jgi:thiol-disulfide isomerase/thioredoxin
MSRRLARGTRIALGALLLAGCGGSAEAYRPIAVGEPAPAYAAPTLAGDTVRVGPGAAAPLTLVNVWATWCGPCKDEFPELEAIHRAYAPRGLRVLGVSIDHADDATVRDFVRAEGATFPIARDPDGRVRDAFLSLGVPESYLVGTDGRLLWRGIGAIPPGGAEVRGEIERALAR